MRRAAFTLLVGIAPLVACNAITGLSDDYTLDLTGEGGAGGDASSDAAGDRTGDSSGPGCTSSDPSLVFCDDFDTPRDGSAFGWDREEVNGGSIELVDSIGNGGTRGLRARLGSSGGSRKVALWKELTGAFTSLTLRFKFSVVGKSTSYFVIGAFGFAQQPGNYRSYGLAAHDGDRVDQSDPPAPANADALPFTPGTFYDAEIAVARAGSRYSSRLTVGGTVVDEREDANLGDTTPTKIEVGVGAFFTSIGGGGEVVVDDVTVSRR